MANPEHILDIGDTILVNQKEFPLKPKEILESQEAPASPDYAQGFSEVEWIPY